MAISKETGFIYSVLLQHSAQLMIWPQPGTASWPGGKVSTSGAGDMGSDPCFPWSSHIRDLKIGTLVATRHRASARTGWPGVNML